MTTTTLFSSNRFMSMYKASLLRLRPLIIFYTAVSFFFFPLQYLLTILGSEERGYGSYNFVGITELYAPLTLVIFSGLMFLIPIIVGASVYSDMHSKKAIDLYHSLPVTREITMLARFSAAMTAITVPLVFNYIVTIVIQAFHTQGIPIRYALGDMLCWFAVCFTMLAILSFVATQVGTIFDTIIMTLGLYCVLPFLYLTVMGVCETFVYGYSMNSGMNEELLMNLSPIPLILKRFVVSGTYNRYSDITGADLPLFFTELNKNSIAIIIWFIIGICLLFAATKFYQKRKSEQAESTDAKGILKVVLKFSGTFIASILMGYLFYAIFGEINYFYFGIVAGAILAYLVIEIILSRGFKGTLRAIPISIITGVVTVGFVFVLSNGAFGYEGRVPSIDSIESITIDYRGEYGNYNERTQTYNTLSNVTLESDEAKQIILDAHKMQVALQKQGQWKTEIKHDTSYDSRINITYTMKNGKDMYRRYRHTYNEAAAKIAELEVNDEFITKTHPIFRTEYKAITDLTILNSRGKKTDVDVNEIQFDKLKTAIQTDLLNETYEQRTDSKIPLGFIKINYRDVEQNRNDIGIMEEIPANTWFSDSYYIVSENSVNTLAVINENGWNDYIKTDFSQIEAVYVTSDNYKGSNSRFIRQTNIDGQIADDFEQPPYSDYDDRDMYVSKDKAEISQLIGAAKVSIPGEEKVAFIVMKSADARKNDAMLSYAIRFDDLPKALQERLARNYMMTKMDRYGRTIYLGYDETEMYGDILPEENYAVEATTEKRSVAVIG